MPEFYDKDIMMVDEADFVLDDNAEDFVVEETDFVLDDNLEDFVVDEDEAIDQESQFIVEEQLDDDTCIPGSPIQYTEDVQEVKEKTWQNDQDHACFVSYLKDKLTKIPRHSGQTVPGCERAKAFLRSLDSEISKAMRTDLDGVVDESEVDGLRKKIDDMVDRLEKQIKKLTGTTKVAHMNVRLVSEDHCDKCGSISPMWHDIARDELVCMSCDSSFSAPDNGLEKTATTPAINVYVSAFERAIVGTMINSKVSAGRNIEETYEHLKNKYNFNPREELAIQQLVADYGYPIIKDRGRLNEPTDPSSGNSVDWLTQYYA